MNEEVVGGGEALVERGGRAQGERHADAHAGGERDEQGHAQDAPLPAAELCQKQ